MGGSSSKEVIVKVESEESKHMKLIYQLENQLKQLKEEVTSVPAVITESDGVNKTVDSIQDAVVIRYTDLTDTSVLKDNVEALFKKSPAKTLVSESAVTVLQTLRTTREMKEINRWYEQKRFERNGDKVFGIELHYTVRAFEEKKGMQYVSGSKDTVVMIAYKVVVHTMNGDIKDYPTKGELEAVEL